MKNANKEYRFEKKHLLSNASAHILKQRMSYVLKPDTSNPNGQYHISSLYFDDQYNSSFYDKQNGVTLRDKFRARFYNNNFDTIRLERKHKHGEMTHKDSALLTLEQYRMMERGNFEFMKHRTESVFEAFYSSHIRKHMRPVVMVCYDRQAYIHPAGNVRIAFDTGLSASMPMSAHSFPILAYTKNTILEVKYDHFIPSFIIGLLSGIPITSQTAISKFIIAKLALQGGAYIA